MKTHQSDLLHALKTADTMKHSFLLPCEWRGGKMATKEKKKEREKGARGRKGVGGGGAWGAGGCDGSKDRKGESEGLGCIARSLSYCVSLLELAA